MALDLLRECVVHGPALPEPFVRDDLERELARAVLLPGPIALDGLPLLDSFEQYRRALRLLRGRGGPIWVRNHAIAPLVARLGYASLGDAGQVTTREGDEDGGALLTSADGLARLRVFCTDFEADLDAPARRGEAYRYSPLRSAQRVLLQCGERLGLLTNGVELRLLISDAARPDSQIVIPLEPGWKRRGPVPDSYKLLLSLATPKGLAALPALIEKARLQQTRVTKDLRRQAREAVERFLQEVLDHPDNQARLAAEPDKAALARALWHEGLVTVYRLLFVLSLEASDNPARSFRFASASLWRGTFSPTLGLGLGQHPGVTLRQQIDDILEGRRETGRFLEDGLRQLFRVFAEGLSCSGLTVRPLGGALFGAQATPWLTALRCGERAVAHLLDRLLWTPARKGAGRQRVHYGPLDVEDLGRVYEALLELEPGIAVEPMCRLRRQKLEVVVPLQQGERYRPQAAPTPAEATDAEDEEADAEEPEEADAEAEGERAPARAGKTRVEWVEEIPSGRFYLRVGLGRKATGSYYTPTSFVRFLVRETLGPQVAERSPDKDPRPLAILGLRVLDPAMGSGHFLVEACRFLGDRLYEACRQCDELAAQAEEQARASRDAAERAALQARAADLWRRVEELPDPNNVLLAYLPSRAPEGQQSGVSLREAEALCKRLVAVHCLYGVDKNPLAVELARLCLWIESHAEGLPLTFLDHRLVRGDSLTGPFFEHLRKRPGSQELLEDLFGRGLVERLEGALGAALQQVRALEASVGTDVADTQQKEGAKARLDRALAALRVVAAAWSGGVMLGKEGCDDPAYEDLVRVVGKSGELPALLSTDKLAAMVARGLGVAAVPRERDALLGVVLAGEGVPALSYDLTFPEVFYPEGKPGERRGFDVVLGNPPWDKMLPADKEFFASYDFEIMNAPTQRERAGLQASLLNNKSIISVYRDYLKSFSMDENLISAIYEYQFVYIDNEKTIGKQDLFRVFLERNKDLLSFNSRVGILVPSAFHSNEGATGVRKLYLRKMSTSICFSFENQKKLFEIDSRFKFDVLVAKNIYSELPVQCAFYRRDDAWLSDPSDGLLSYSWKFIDKTGGEYLSLLELKSKEDFALAERVYLSEGTFINQSERFRIKLGRELNMTDDAWRFSSTSTILGESSDPRDSKILSNLHNRGFLVLHEGKTFHQYNDHWDQRPRYLVSISQLKEKPTVLTLSRYYRLAFREIARSNDERTAIFCLLPPGATFGNKAPCERRPSERATSSTLLLLAVCNSYCFDMLLRQRVAATINLFLIHPTPVPVIDDIARRIFLAHAALRLTCNHEGYAPLWHEQLGADTWREPTPKHTWPVLASDDDRWAVRAAIDAVVADAYGLTRDQYQHVLSTFSHRSYPKAPERCLAAFDQLKTLGLEAFTRQHDPYHDIPLNEALPQPVIDLPALAGEPVAAPASGVTPITAARSRRTPAPPPAQGTLDLPMAAEPRPPYGAPPKRPRRPRT